MHVDRDPEMCVVALEKKAKARLSNLDIWNEGVEELSFTPESLAACTCIHALYTFPKPQEILKKIYGWLTPGGYGIFVDPGRPVRVLDWQIAIGRQMLKTHGLKKTLQVMKEGKEVSKQNRRAAKMQATGTFWVYSHKEFCKSVENAGFVIEESWTTFRGISDLVVVRK
ncbi:MAG: methyltransferase domain-containing protein [Bacteroidota bacterium]